MVLLPSDTHGCPRGGMGVELQVRGYTPPNAPPGRPAYLKYPLVVMALAFLCTPITARTLPPTRKHGAGCVLHQPFPLF